MKLFMQHRVICAVSCALLLSVSSVMMAKVTGISSKQQFAEILSDTANTNKLIVVDFYASWCPPCKGFHSTFEALSNTYPDAIFVKVDIDAVKDVAKQYHIRAMPTFKFIVNHVVVSEVVGADKAKVEAAIKKHKYTRIII